MHPKTLNYSMWPPLAAITRSNSGQKLLQPFLTNPFLINSQTRFTETLSSFLLLWSVLHTFSTMCVHKLKSKGFKSGDCGCQKFMLASNQYWTAFARCAGAPSCWEDVISVFLVMFLTHDRTPVSKILCKRQRLACSHVQRTSKAHSPLSMLWRQPSWVRLNAWLLTLWGVQTYYS